MSEETAVEPKKRGRPTLTEEQKASNAEDRAKIEAKERREAFLKSIDTEIDAKFKDFSELQAFYDTKQAKRVDSVALSNSSEVVREGSDILFKVHASTDPETPQTMPEGAYTLNDTGKVTFCKRLKMSYNYFVKYPVNDEMIEHFNELNRIADSEWYVRTLVENGKTTVEGVLPKRFTPFDNSFLLNLLKSHNPKLEMFVEGDFDKAVDLYDLSFEGAFPYDSLKPALRVVNSEVDMAPLQLSMGLTDGKHFYISMEKKRGGIKLPHREKSGMLADHININDLISNQQELRDKIIEAPQVDVDKDETTDFLVEKLGILSRDAGNFVTDYFVANPGEDNLLVYVNGLLSAAKAFAPAKMVKVSNTAISMLYRDIPTPPYLQ